MKQKLTCIGLVLGVVLMFAGCSSDSPTAPKPSPTPAAYSISLTSSSDSAEVGNWIVLSARVTQGGSNVPDNTGVTFRISGQCVDGGSYVTPNFENAKCLIVRTTLNGVATAQILSMSAYTVEVVASVPNANVAKVVRFYQPTTSYELAIYGVSPNRGSSAGGQSITIYGKGFSKPVEVDFLLGSIERPAIVTDVNTAGTELRVVTPAAPLGTDEDSTVADIKVTAAAGTDDSVTDTLLQCFIFQRDTGPGGAPAIYSISPAQGLASGGEQVTIYGANFVEPVRVRLGEEDAQVLSISEDNATVVIVTPVHSGPPQQPGDANLTVDVTLIAQVGSAQEESVTRTEGWTWLPPSQNAGAPVIYQIIPNKGKWDGGDTVRILGKNLCGQYGSTSGTCSSAPDVKFTPGGAAVVVHFATDGNEIEVLTPAAATSAPLEDVPATVEVTNKGGTYTLQNGFLYLGVKPAEPVIYQIIPNQGSPRGGEEVTIVGANLCGAKNPTSGECTAAPTVVFAVPSPYGNRTAVVKTFKADGSELKVTTPTVSPDPVTTNQVTDVTVSNGTDAATLEGGFTYLAEVLEPQIYSLVPSSGLVTGGEEVTILGANFIEPLSVKFGAENAVVVSVSTDHGTVVVKSPKHSGPPSQPGDAPVTVDVTITTQLGTSNAPTVTRDQAWTWLPTTSKPNTPVIYQLIPAKGAARGGDEVRILGAELCGLKDTITMKCIQAPTVTFTPPGTTAEVLSFAEDGSELKVLTPPVSPQPVVQDTNSTVTVTNSAGTSSLQNGYLYLAETRPPEIYSVQPNQGSSLGGDQVTIFGRFFVKPIKVDFSGAGTADVISVSEDATQIVVRTPATASQPLEQDLASSVTVTTQAGTGRDQQVTRSNAYIYLAEHPTPEIFALSPASGPIEGGTRVTITGKGFQYPVQVFFGDHQAQVVSSNFNQIICVSPSLTPTEPDTPTTVQVTVLNITTGKKSEGMPFRYGEAMFISAITPNRGPADAETTVTIFGQGFVGPVKVVIGIPDGDLEASVLSVSGTEIIIKAQPLPADRRTCGTVSGNVKVTNINSNISASGPTFFYDAPTPLITSVDIYRGDAYMGVALDNRLPQYNTLGTGACLLYPWNMYTVVIHGTNFQTIGAGSAMVVRIPGVTADIPTTYYTATGDLIFTLPDLTGVVMQEISCTEGGACGLQYVDTPLAVTVKNLRNGCSDTLNGAIIIEPCDTSCRLTGLSTLTVTAPATMAVGAASAVTLAFTPTPLTSPVTVNLAYVGFTATPATAVIPAGIASPFIVPVTPGAAGSGNIMASVGAGICAVSAISGPINVIATPTITSVNPNTGSAAGGLSVTITGTNLAGATSVTFGGTSATIVTNTATSITCTTPGHAAGVVDVAVTTPGGTATLVGGFTYVSPTPLILIVSPTSGPAAGGTTVEISGTNLTGTTSVTFGGVAASGLVVDGGKITCVTPPGTAGAVAVVVTTPFGTADASFTYL